MLLRAARETVGAGFRGHNPPADLLRAFSSASVSAMSASECDRECAALRGETELLEDADPDAAGEYRELVRSIRDLEERAEEDGRRQRERREEIQRVRDSWLERLRTLVADIAERFGRYFAEMGFAGDVELNTGKHEVNISSFYLWSNPQIYL